MNEDQAARAAIEMAANWPASFIRDETIAAWGRAFAAKPDVVVARFLDMAQRNLEHPPPMAEVLRVLDDLEPKPQRPALVAPPGLDADAYLASPAHAQADPDGSCFLCRRLGA